MLIILEINRGALNPFNLVFFCQVNLLHDTNYLHYPSQVH